MHAQSAMFSRAFQADPDPQADGRPLRVVALTLETPLNTKQTQSAQHISHRADREVRGDWPTPPPVFRSTVIGIPAFMHAFHLFSAYFLKVSAKVISGQ